MPIDPRKSSSYLLDLVRGRSRTPNEDTEEGNVFGSDPAMAAPAPLIDDPYPSNPTLQGLQQTEQPMAVTPPVVGAGEIPALTAPPVPQADTSAQEQRYLGQIKSMNEDDARRRVVAESLSSKNTMLARLGGAFNTIGQGLAQQKPDNTPFDKLAEDAKYKEPKEKDKTLQNYMLDKYKWDRNLPILKERLAISKTGAEANALKGKAFTMNAETNQGNQALAATAKNTKDDVVSRSNVQIAQLNKDIGQLNNAKNGKIKLTSTLIAELQKGYANVIAGGTSSTLGDLERQEFTPIVEKAQKIKDLLNGYQEGVDVPQYATQLLGMMTALRSDINGIRKVASERIYNLNKDAVSKNPVAIKALEANRAYYANPDDVKDGSSSGAAESDDKRIAELLAKKAAGTLGK